MPSRERQRMLRCSSERLLCHPSILQLLPVYHVTNFALCKMNAHVADLPGLSCEKEAFLAGKGQETRNTRLGRNSRRIVERRKGKLKLSLAWKTEL